MYIHAVIIHNCDTEYDMKEKVIFHISLVGLTFAVLCNVIYFIKKMACLHVNLFGIGPHRLKDSFSSLVNHCFTSHYSSSWIVQIDRILHTLIRVSILFTEREEDVKQILNLR